MHKKLYTTLFLACALFAQILPAQVNLTFPIIDMGAASSHRYFNLFKARSIARASSGQPINVPIWSQIDCDCNATIPMLSNTTGSGGRWDVFEDVARHSQSSLLSQVESDVRISNQMLYAIEYPFVMSLLYTNSLIDPMDVYKCFTGVTMNREARTNLNIEYMPSVLIEHIDYLRAELDYPLNKDGKKYECYILERNDNIDSLLKNTQKILWTLSIKGGHILSTGTFLYQGQTDMPDFKTIVFDNIERLKGLKPTYRSSGQAITLTAPIFSISFDGYFADGLCGKSAKFLPVEKDAFAVQDLTSGVTPVGQEAIVRLLSKENGQQRILIDIVGMNIKSRDWYYSYIKERRYLKDSIPIMAMGVGVNGLKSGDKEYGYEDEVMKENPPSLLNNRHANLNREDIIQIIQSHGLVGISLERTKLMGGMFWSRYKATIPGSAERRRVAVQAIAANICKFIQVAQTREAWDMICIASQFDLYGRFLEPYSSTDDLPQLGKDLYQFFSNPVAIDGVFTEREIRQFMYGLKAEDLVERIMFRNAYRFMLKHYPNKK
jgi:hypothetical protein